MKPYWLRKGAAMNNISKSILVQVCESLNLSEKQVLSKSRLRPICEARFLAMHFIRASVDDVSLTTIGEWFGRPANGTAHSFVLYGIKQTKILKGVSPAFQDKFDKCERAVAFYSRKFDFNNIPQY